MMNLSNVDKKEMLTDGLNQQRRKSFRMLKKLNRRHLLSFEEYCQFLNQVNRENVEKKSFKLPKKAAMYKL